MATVLAFAFLGTFFYILWRLAMRGREKVSPTRPEPHRGFRLRWASAVLVAFFVLFGIVDDGEQSSSGEDTVQVQPLADRVDQPTPTSEPTPSPEELETQRKATRAAEATAAREERKEVAARKAANRSKARAARAVRERKEANRVKARAENQAKRALAAQEAVDNASPVYDDDDASGDSGSYAEKYAGLNCGDIPESNFPTPPGDPEGWDGDGDGVSCES